MQLGEGAVGPQSKQRAVVAAAAIHGRAVQRAVGVVEIMQLGKGAVGLQFEQRAGASGAAIRRRAVQCAVWTRHERHPRIGAVQVRCREGIQCHDRGWRDTRFRRCPVRHDGGGLTEHQQPGKHREKQPVEEAERFGFDLNLPGTALNFHRFRK